MADNKEFKVEILKYPTDEDWMLCKLCTLNTIGKTSCDMPSSMYLRKWSCIAAVCVFRKVSVGFSFL